MSSQVVTGELLTTLRKNTQCSGCRERDARIEQLTVECRRLDERISYEDASRRDKRRREETAHYSETA